MSFLIGPWQISFAACCQSLQIFSITIFLCVSSSALDLKCDLIPFLMFCFISLENSSQWVVSQISFWSFVSPTYTTLSWCFRFSASHTTLSFSGLCRMSTLNMCLAISFVSMTTLVELQSISRWHCWSTPPHLWSLYNGPNFWGNLSQSTFPFHELATFANWTPPIAKSKASEWIPKSLSKLGNFNIDAFTKMPFKVSKASLHASSHS